jgi:hypothetical protein
MAPMANGPAPAVETGVPPAAPALLVELEIEFEVTLVVLTGIDPVSEGALRGFPFKMAEAREVAVAVLRLMPWPLAIDSSPPSMALRRGWNCVGTALMIGPMDPPALSRLWRRAVFVSRYWTKDANVGSTSRLPR